VVFVAMSRFSFRHDNSMRGLEWVFNEGMHQGFPGMPKPRFEWLSCLVVWCSIGIRSNRAFPVIVPMPHQLRGETRIRLVCERTQQCQSGGVPVNSFGSLEIGYP
jgi:hypothetical protein